MNQLGMIGGYATMLTTGMPFLVIAAIFLELARRMLGRQRAARGWPATRGQVLMSDIQAQTRRSGLSGGRSTTYYATVIYQYRIGGADYRCNRISPGDELGFGNSDRAMARARRYPAGAEVQVFYNPVNPAEAVLELASPRMTLLFWIGGAMVLFVLLSSAFSFALLRYTQGIVDAVAR